MALTKTINIDGQEVMFRASAAVPRIYRIKFRRDIYKDLDALQKAIDTSKEEASTLDTFSLELFENIAYVMAKHADPKVPDSPEEWLEQFNTFTIKYLSFDHRVAPFNDVRVRQAINYATNKEAIVKVAYSNAAEPLSGPLPKNINGFNESLVPYEYNVAKAKELLAEAGYPDGFTTTLYISDKEIDTKLATVLQAQLAGIAATRAGVKGKDIDAAARKVICDAGYGEYFGHGYGHSLGLEVHEAPNCNPSGETEMPVGAVCSAEPGIYIPGKFGVRIEDVVVFTADGCKNITKSPKNLIIV